MKKILTLCLAIALSSGLLAQNCQLRTQTQQQWGAAPAVSSVGTYLHANFEAAFPNDLVVGCTPGFTLKLTHKWAVTNFLPSTGLPTALSSNLWNPVNYQNTFAGEVVTLALTLGFSDYDAAFASGDLASATIVGGTFAGWTVQQVFDEANRKLGGCPSTYSVAQLLNIVQDINASFVNGVAVNPGLLSCAPAVCPTISVNTVVTNNTGTCSGASGTICGDFNIESLAHGTNVNNLFAGVGVTITVTHNSSVGTNDAVIYDTDGNWTEDPDLNVDQGNVIIINENPANNDGDGNGPDDAELGGTQTYTFDQPVTVVSFLFIDADKDGSFATAYDENNNVITTVQIPNLGNASVQTVTMNAPGTRKLVFNYHDSGGIRLNLECAPAGTPPICEEFDITSLAHGTKVNDYFAGIGVTITVTHNSPLGTNDAVIYDTDGNWTEDPDLNVDQGNVIIINENPNNNDGDGHGPDDAVLGGTQTFLFDEPVTVVSFLFIDADKNGSFATAYDENNNVIATVQIPNLGNASVQTVVMNAPGTKKLVINYRDSGGIRLNLECPPQNVPSICEEFDISSLTHGTLVNDYFAAQGITITVTHNSPLGTNNAVIYDTDGSWTEDPDLNVGQGNVVIINENPANNDGDGNGPDDAILGGTQTYTFDEPVTVVSFLFIDSDHDGSFATAYDENNNVITTVQIPNMGNASVQTVVMNAPGTRKLVFNYRDSGGIRLNLECPPTPGNAPGCNGNATAFPSGGTPPYSYSWSNGDTTQTADGLCDGTYTVTVTDDNGCTGTVSVDVLCTAAKEGAPELAVKEESEFQMTAYPNPFEKVVQLEFSLNETSRVKAEILSTDGRIIRTLFDGTATGDEKYQFSFQSGNLAGGLYFYRLITEDGVVHYTKLLLVR